MIRAKFNIVGEIDHKKHVCKDQIASMRLSASSYFKMQGFTKYYLLLFSNSHSDMRVITNDNKYNLDLYYLLLIPPGQSFEIEAVSKHNDLYVIYFSKNFLNLVTQRYDFPPGILENYFAQVNLIEKNNWLNEITHRYFFEIYTAKIKESCCSDFLEQEILKEVYYLGVNKNPKYCDRLNIDSQFLSGKSAQIKRALIYIESNLSSPLTVIDVASMTNISPSTLKRKFPEELGVSVHQYIQTRRLEESYKLLKNRQFNVNEVCTNVGLSSTSSFIKLFKNKYGITPGKVT